MRLLPRLSPAGKFVALVLMGALLAVQPLLDARRTLASAETSGPVTWCSDGRNPIIDRLLPEGAGGTVFYTALGDKAGVAFQASGTIGLALDGMRSEDSVETELHERAHLLEFARPDIVARLMRGQPPPRPGQYAATNAVEHFAEMAGQAWKVTGLLLPGTFCTLDSPATLLRRIEDEVPGTAGFVAWYLRDPVLAAVEGAGGLRAEAERLVVDRRADWELLYATLRERRLPDGGFSRWPQYSMSEYLDRRRAHVRLVGGFSGRVEAAQITASLALLNVAGER